MLGMGYIYGLNASVAALGCSTCSFLSAQQPWRSLWPLGGAWWMHQRYPLHQCQASWLPSCPVSAQSAEQWHPPHPEQWRCKTHQGFPVNQISWAIPGISREYPPRGGIWRLSGLGLRALGRGCRTKYHDLKKLYKLSLSKARPEMLQD